MKPTAPASFRVRLLPVLLMALLVGSTIGGITLLRDDAKASPVPTAASAPSSGSLWFEADHGQPGAIASFTARDAGYALGLGKDIQLVSEDQAVLLSFVGGHAVPTPGALQGAVSNYFHGTQRVAGVEHYGQVAYDQVWPGIGLSFYANADHALEFDAIVAPGAKVEAIRFAVSGATPVLQPDGSLKLGATEDAFVLQAPVAFQDGPAGRTAVDSAFVVDGEQVSFQVGAYDSARTLVIDPKVVYGTYFGSSAYYYAEQASDIASSPSEPGVVYMAGMVMYYPPYYDTSDFPTKGDVFDAKGPKKGDYDYYLAKFDTSKDGEDSLVWVNYLGGTSYEFGNPQVAADQTGVYLAASYVASTDFPKTASAYSSGVGSYDDVLVKLSLDGKDLLYGTYFGTIDYDYYEITGMDARDGKVGLVTSQMNCATCGYATWTTKNAYQATSADATSTSYFQDLIVALFDTTQSGDASLLFLTYLGGDTNDYPSDLKIDDQGHVLVSGMTYAATAAPAKKYPTTTGAYYSTIPGSYVYQNFVSRLDFNGADATTLGYSTMLPGGTYGQSGLFADSDGTILFGAASSGSWATTSGAYQTSSNGGQDGAIVRLDPSKTGTAQLLAGTYLGNEAGECCSTEAISAIGRDDEGNVIVIGIATQPLQFPAIKSREEDLRLTCKPCYQPGAFFAKLPLALDDLLATDVATPSTDGLYGQVLGDVSADGIGYAASAGPSGAPTPHGYSTFPKDDSTDNILFRFGPAEPDVTCTGPSQVFRLDPATFVATLSERDYPIDDSTVRWWIDADYETEAPDYAAATPKLSYDKTWDLNAIPGHRDITVAVKDTHGLEGFGVCSMELLNRLPVPVADLPESVLAGTTLIMDGSDSFDADTEDLSVAAGEWKVLPVPTCSNINQLVATCTFDTPGSYVVDFGVVDRDGGYSNLLFPVQVMPTPGAEFTWQKPAYACGSAGIQLNDLSIPASSSIAEWAWDFGNDGTIDSTQQDAILPVTGAGTFPVRLTVTDSGGLSSTTLHDVAVDYPAPANAVIRQDNADYPIYTSTPFHFIDASTAGSLPIAGSSWLVDGEAAIHGADWVSTFDVGQHIITLKVTDSAGCVSQAFYTAVVTSPPLPPQPEGANLEPKGPQALWSADPYNPIANQAVQFIDQSLADLAPLNVYGWTFGDGTSSTDRQPVHRFAEPGTYVVSLTVKDQLGFTSTKAANVLVRAIGEPPAVGPATALPVAVAGADLVVRSGDLVRLDGNQSTVAQGLVIRHEWRQIEGPTVSLQGAATPKPTFQAPALVDGNLETTLIFRLVVNDGTRASAGDIVQVRVLPAISPGFALQQGKSGLVEFTSENLPADATLSWDFGDGTVSDQAAPDHLYEKSGKYTIRLTVHTADGDVVISRDVDVTVGSSGGSNTSKESDGPLKVAGVPVTWAAGIFVAAAAIVFVALLIMARRR